MKYFLFFASMLFLVPVTGYNQETKPQPPGEFSTSSGRHFWMGKNYRQEWNTPITAPVLKISTEKGGLTPVKLGGGKQTKSLRLEDAEGRQYTLRSIKKFITGKSLPLDLESDAAIDLVSDGVSASYPYAAVSVTVLAEAAGIPHNNPRVVVIADDPKLGEYREEFANMLALFEERLPDSVRKAYDTDEVVAKLEDDNDHRIDQASLLKIRILDMFIMDFDRHEGQWTWGAYDNENGKGNTYYPIAKDRDQAFYINRGLIPGILKSRSLVPQLEGLKPETKSIARFNFAARNLDRFFLNELPEITWKLTADQFVAQMTDEVIDRAIAQQPAEIRDISGPEIASILKERRKYLVEEVMEYYRFLSETVSITGSDKKELFKIIKNDDNSFVDIEVYKINKEGEVTSRMYERRFNPDVTKELRLYGFGGDDQFVVSGKDDKIKIRLIGGGGQDVFENPSGSPKSVLVYDRSDKDNKLSGGFKNKMSKDTLINRFDRLYYKYPYQSFFVTAGFNPDDGVSLGPTFKYIRHGFRKDPYKSSHLVRATYAFSTRAINASYAGEFISVFGRKTDLLLDAEFRGPNNTTNFFGYGITTTYDKSNPGRFRYYRVRYDFFDAALLLRHRFSDKVTLAIGPKFQYYTIDPDDKLNGDRNIVQNTMAIGLNPATVFSNQTYFGGKAAFTVDTRNNRNVPDKGINWVTTVNTMKGLSSKSYDLVTQVNSDFSFYLNLVKDWLVFADRFGGGTTLADNGFEFFQAQYVGTEDNLRGFRKYRFAGKSKVYNQAELRLKLGNLRTYLFPASIGIFGFVDAGRVWVENDTDKKVQVGYGGGIWFSPLRRYVFTLSLSASKEDIIPLFGFGWKF